MKKQDIGAWMLIFIVVLVLIAFIVMMFMMSPIGGVIALGVLLYVNTAIYLLTKEES